MARFSGAVPVTEGEPGPQGFTGPRGYKGDTGPSGADGEDASFTIGTVTNTMLPDRVNLCTNPSFEVGTDGWTAFTSNADGSISSVTDSSAVSGSKVCVFQPTSGSQFAMQAIEYIFIPTPGRTYTVSGSIRTPNFVNTHSMGLYVHAYTESDTWLDTSSYDTGINITTHDWVRLSSTMTVPQNTAYLKIILSTGNEDANKELPSMYDAILIEEASEVNDYFDGNSDLSSWDGTTNQSTSSQLLPSVSVTNSGTSSAAVLDFTFNF